jgi:hypothetical protein
VIEKFRTLRKPKNQPLTQAAQNCLLKSLNQTSRAIIAWTEGVLIARIVEQNIFRHVLKVGNFGRVPEAVGGNCRLLRIGGFAMEYVSNEVFGGIVWFRFYIALMSAILFCCLFMVGLASRFLIGYLQNRLLEETAVTNRQQTLPAAPGVPGLADGTLQGNVG